jgi:glutathione synthase/RimK-type ligase-like ATP-grasp enzyme
MTRCSNAPWLVSGRLHLQPGRRDLKIITVALPSQILTDRLVSSVSLESDLEYPEEGLRERTLDSGFSNRAMSTPPVKIIFLTTQPPSDIKAEWPYYQNWSLPVAMRRRGAQVSITSWRDAALSAEALIVHDVITFLWCNDYHLHPNEFQEFIRTRLLQAQKLRPAIRVINEASVVLWNMDKALYLGEVRDAGFLVPRTEAIRDLTTFLTVGELSTEISKLLGDKTALGSIVLKPSISGSSKQTHLITSPTSLKAVDNEFLAQLLKTGIDGSLLVQEYESAISNGEYSLVFIGGKHTHTVIKIPTVGEFRCQAEFGGDEREIKPEEVPEQARQTAAKVMHFLNEKVGEVTYCRIDGVVRKLTGEFVLMEIEAIEPDLWLEMIKDPKIKETLYAALLGSDKPED